MKLLTAATLVLLSLVPWAHAREESRIIKIAVRLDDSKNFGADSLSLAVLFRKSTEHGWRQLGTLKPDEGGNFIVAVPSDGWLALELSTSDPTVRRDGHKEDELDFYTLKGDQRIVVLRDEFRVGGGGRAPFEKRYKLQRGAAFTPCMSRDIGKGSVQFKKLLDADERGINVWDFGDAEAVHGSVIGGLVPGRWHIRYFDADDVERNSQVVDLSSGQLLRAACGAP